MLSVDAQDIIAVAFHVLRIGSAMSVADRADDPLDLDEPEFVYELKKPVGLRPVFYLFAGLACLGLAGFMFLIGLLLPPERQAFPVFIGSTVIPTLGALALFGSAFQLMRSPRRVTVGSTGLAVEGSDGEWSWTWDEIGWATVATAALTPQKRLVVYDPAGKKLVTLGAEFEDFHGLAESIKAGIARKPDEAAGRVQSRKARKSAAFLILGGIAFLALAFVNGFNAQNEKADAKRLAQDGIETEASVLRHYLYNVTPRIEYAFSTPEGREVRRDAMMQQADWNALQRATTVPVRYVPADPENNRLVSGEVEDQFGDPAASLFLSVGVGVMALLFLSVGLMQWFGWDLDLDSKTGRVSIKRFGTGR